MVSNHWLHYRWRLNSKFKMVIVVYMTNICENFLYFTSFFHRKTLHQSNKVAFLCHSSFLGIFYFDVLKMFIRKLLLILLSGSRRTKRHKVRDQSLGNHFLLVLLHYCDWYLALESTTFKMYPAWRANDLFTHVFFGEILLNQQWPLGKVP